MAQSATYIGAEVAYSADRFHINDPGGRITQPDISSALWGVNLRYLMNKHLFVETGVYARAYKIGLAFDGDYGSQSTDRTGYLVPVRVGARLPLFKEAIAVCPVAGISFGVADEGDIIKGEGSRSGTGVDPIRYKYTVQHSSQVISLLQAGMGIDIRLWPKTLLSLNTNYYGGINKILVQHIEYTPGSGTAIKATQHTKGGFYTVGIGFKCAVDWF